MVIQDPNDPDSGGVLDSLGENMEELTAAVAAGVGLYATKTDLVALAMDGLKTSFETFKQTFQQEIVKSNDSLVSVNTSLARVTEDYAVTIAQSTLPLKTAIDALVDFEMAGIQEVPASVLQLAGVMSLTNQKQENFVKLITDAMVFGGLDAGGTDQLAQNMMRVSDEFSVSFDKLVQALEPVATNSAKLALVSETAALSNFELVTELAGTVGQDATGLLRNVIEQLGSFGQISPNEFAFRGLQAIKDSLQEGDLSAEEFKELLPLAISQVETFIGPILEKREGIQTLERLQAGELFNLDLLAQMKALAKQIEIGNAREEDPQFAGFRTLSEFQVRLFDSFYESIASMDETKLILLAENLGKIGAVLLEIGSAVAPVVAAVLESVRTEFNDTLAGGAGQFLSELIGGSETIANIADSTASFLSGIPMAGNMIETFRQTAVAAQGGQPLEDGVIVPAIQALLTASEGDLNFARQFTELQNAINRQAEDSVIEAQAERVFKALTGTEPGAVAIMIDNDRARAVALLEQSISAPNITDALIEKLEIAIDTLNNTTENALGEIIQINSGGFADMGETSRARMAQDDARAAAGSN